jgi:uncharacterized protein YceK
VAKKGQSILPDLVPNQLKFVGLLGLVVAGLLLSGCATVMASRQPNAKNLDLFKAGTPRQQVIAEFGWPQHSQTVDGKRTDNFTFVQGYSKGAKIGRTLFHGIADAVTLFTWEVVGTPTELIFNGTNMVVKVTYDSEDKVLQSEILVNK